MLHEHMIRKALDDLEGVFRLYEEGRISPLILGVNLRRHADDLGVLDQQAAADLGKLADAVDALPAIGDRKGALRAIRDQFETYRKQVLARLKAEDAKDKADTDAARAAAEVDTAEKIRLVRAAEDAARKRAQAAVDAVQATTSKPAPTAPAATPAEPQEDAATKATLEEMAGLGGDGEDPPEVHDDVKNMTVDDIEKILNETKRKL